MISVLLLTALCVILQRMYLENELGVVTLRSAYELLRSVTVCDTYSAMSRTCNNCIHTVLY